MSHPNFEIAKGERVVLVAHGESSISSTIWSHRLCRTITRHGKPLLFDEAREYIRTGRAPEYVSSSFGKFQGLKDFEYNAIFGREPHQPNEAGLTDTGLRLKGDVAGERVFALRGRQLFISMHHIEQSFQGAGRVTLLACREWDDRVRSGDDFGTPEVNPEAIEVERKKREEEAREKEQHGKHKKYKEDLLHRLFGPSDERA